MGSPASKEPQRSDFEKYKDTITPPEIERFKALEREVSASFKSGFGSVRSLRTDAMEAIVAVGKHRVAEKSMEDIWKSTHAEVINAKISHTKREEILQVLTELHKDIEMLADKDPETFRRVIKETLTRVRNPHENPHDYI